MFIDKCKVYLLHASYMDSTGVHQFLKDEGVGKSETYTDATSPDTIPEVAGRVCYMSFANPRPGGNKAYLDNILKQGHGSVLEHSTIGLILTGISRSCSHELVRHRAGFAFSQLSQRYVDSKDVAFIVPHELQRPENATSLSEFRKRCLDARDDYDNLSQALLPQALTFTTEMRKQARQAARSILPNATETKMVVSANVRAWRHFIELRGSPGAEPEIRKLAKAVFDVVAAESPNLFADYTWTPHTDGTQTVQTPHRKV